MFPPYLWIHFLSVTSVARYLSLCLLHSASLIPPSFFICVPFPGFVVLSFLQHAVIHFFTGCVFFLPILFLRLWPGPGVITAEQRLGTLRGLLVL